MNIPKIKEHLKGLWRALQGAHEVPGYLSMVEVLYVLRGDMHLVLRLASCNKDALHPLILNRKGEVVGLLILPSLFVSLVEDGWIASDDNGNYRPTEVGLAQLARHERLHLEAGNCPECGEPIRFFPAEAAAIEKDAEGKARLYHCDCHITQSAKRRGDSKSTSLSKLPS